MQPPRPDVFGWFDRPGDETPTHDPGMTGICPACGKTLSRPVRTISLMAVGDDRSFFFRAHRECWEGLSEDDRTAIESIVVDDIPWIRP